MAYNESLAQVIRETTAGTENLVEKRMFGGIAFLLNGNMSVGVHKDSLVVRVDKKITKYFWQNLMLKNLT